MLWTVDVADATALEAAAAAAGQVHHAGRATTTAAAIWLPMASVSAPAGYNHVAITDMQTDLLPASFFSGRQADVIVVMSESLWDPTKMSSVRYSADPMPTIRASQSGQVFSPEFGGMTANVEFEALTGFSNAFLPYGSIPYQQYIRRPLPSATRAPTPCRLREPPGPRARARRPARSAAPR